MKMLVRALCLLSLLSTVTLGLAQNPFVGTWALDPARSQLAGQTLKFGPAAGNAIERIAGASRYSFRIDGTDYRMDSGNLASWKQASPNSWTVTYHTPEGKLLSTDTWQLSPDGDTLNLVSTGTRPNGESFTDAIIYTRTATATPLSTPPPTAASPAAAPSAPPAPGSAAAPPSPEASAGGLMGEWKSTEVKLSSPSKLTIKASGLDGIILEIASIKATCDARFDGRDYHAVGPTVPPALTLALQRTAPNSFQLSERYSGKDVYVARYVVAADGKTMTEVGGAPGAPPQTAVWEKQ